MSSWTCEFTYLENHSTKLSAGDNGKYLVIIQRQILLIISPLKHMS